MKLDGKVAVVTGGGTGIGKATCRRFAREGARVVVNYSASRNEAEEVASSIRHSGGDALAIQANVTVDLEVRALMEVAQQRWGRFDVLVNSAGWSRRTPHHLLDELTDEIWDRTLDVNLRGTFYAMRAAAPFLRQTPGACIINISSIAAETGEGSSMVYAAAKAGVITLTKSFARVMAPEVRVNCIAPGLVPTRFAGWPPETFVKGAEDSPLKRLSTVEEVATAALFLAADATSMTGQTIQLDSGIAALGRVSA